MAEAASKSLKMSVLDERLSVCRLDSQANVRTPDETTFFSMTRAADELSVVCPEKDVPEGVKAENGWRAIKLEGPLDLSLAGVLARILGPLAEAGINVFTISTYDTDYVLVKGPKLEKAVSTLEARGHVVDASGRST